MPMDLYNTPIGNFLNSVGLQDLFGANTSRPPAPQGETLPQAQTRMAGTQGMDPQRQAQLDAQARRAGYRNYEELALRRKQMEADNRGTTTAPGGARSWDEAADNAMAWHPKNLLERVTGALRDATRRD